MDKKDLKKLVKADFSEFLKELGFSKKSEGVYIKVNDNIIQNITFEFGSIGFTCWVVMQPLYVKDYTNFLHLSFGSSLGRFKSFKRNWWSYEEPVKGISEIKELLIENGLPWFDEYGTSKGIIDFISSGKVEEYGFWFNERYQKQYLGFSLLYSGRIDEGIKALNCMICEIGENAADFVKAYNKDMIELLGRIKENPEETPSIIDGIIAENRLALKI